MLEWFQNNYGHLGFDISELQLDRGGFREYVWITHKNKPNTKLKLIPNLQQDYSGGLVFISYDDVYKEEFTTRLKATFGDIINKKLIEPIKKIESLKF